MCVQVANPRFWDHFLENNDIFGKILLTNSQQQLHQLVYTEAVLFAAAPVPHNPMMQSSTAIKALFKKLIHPALRVLLALIVIYLGFKISCHRWFEV